MYPNSLDDIVKENLCSGCGLCATIAGNSTVAMQLDTEGFYRPQLLGTLGLKEWDIIKATCPGVIVEQPEPVDDAKLDYLWGSIQQIAVGYATDDVMRWKASSGGVISALLTFLLDTRQVDFVIHVGVRSSDPFLLTPGVSRTRDEIIQHAGSRYAPTAPLETLGIILRDNPGKCAIVGKPCDISALRRYMEINTEVAERVIVLISFFCAGVPSQNATWDFLEYMGVDKADVASFRYRGYGWPGRATAICWDGTEFSSDYNHAWGQVLNRKLQFRCKICPDGIGELADLVCGDAWVTVNGYPDFEEKPGRSLVIARTKLGNGILQLATNQGFLSVEPMNLNDLNAAQPYQLTRRRSIFPRVLAMRAAGKPVPNYRGFHLVRNAISGEAKFMLSQFLGMYRRLHS